MHGDRGFTILELLIASTVFSVILLLATSGVIQLGRLYHKNLALNRTQETARSIGEEIERSIQFARGSVSAASSLNPDQSRTQCIGNIQYTFWIDRKVENVNGTQNHALLMKQLGPKDTCASQSGGTELLSNNMRLLNFEIIPPDANGLAQINIRIAYGDNDLLDHYNTDGSKISDDPAEFAEATREANCHSGIAGSSFCAVAQLDISAKRRLQ